jgi:hypothetical protein
MQRLYTQNELKNAMTYTLNMATTDRVIEDLDSISRYNKTEDVEVIIWYMVVLENPNRDDYSWIPEPFHFLRENIEVESGIEIARKIQSHLAQEHMKCEVI